MPRKKAISILIPLILVPLFFCAPLPCRAAALLEVSGEFAPGGAARITRHHFEIERPGEKAAIAVSALIVDGSARFRVLDAGEEPIYDQRGGGRVEIWGVPLDTKGEAGSYTLEVSSASGEGTWTARIFTLPPPSALRLYSLFWGGFLIMTGLDAVAGCLHISYGLGKFSLWWVELALLPFAIASVPIIRGCVGRWPREGT